MSLGRACFAVMGSTTWLSAATTVTTLEDILDLDDASDAVSLLQGEVVASSGHTGSVASNIGHAKLQEDPFADLEDSFDTCDDALIFDDGNPSKLDVADISFWVSFCLDIMIFMIVMTTGMHFVQRFELSKKNPLAHEKKQIREHQPVNFGPLMELARSGNEERHEPFQDVARFAAFLDETPDVTRREDASGCTALHIAAESGCAGLAEALIKRGADVNAMEAWDETPLHFAARAGMLNLCRLLMSHGAKLNPRNSQDHTPLLVAAEAGKEEACDFLLELGADVGAVEEADLPPILVSLLMKRMIKPLLPAPADSETDDTSKLK